MSSSSTPSENPPPSPMLSPEQARINTDYTKFKHNAAIAMLIFSPILIAIPPRKLDLYTFSLAGGFVAATNQLTIERTGRGLIQQFGRAGSQARDGLAMEDGNEKRILEEKGRLDEVLARRNGGVSESTGSGIVELARNMGASSKSSGQEPEDWKEQRLKEEQEKLNKGEGYGGMIMDQIWEVWNQGGKKS